MFSCIMSQTLNVDAEMHALGMVEKFKTMSTPSKLDGKIAELQEKLVEAKKLQDRTLKTVLSNVKKRYLSLAETATEVNEGRIVFNHGDKNSFERSVVDFIFGASEMVSMPLRSSYDPLFVFSSRRKCSSLMHAVVIHTFICNVIDS